MRSPLSRASRANCSSLVATAAQARTLRSSLMRSGSGSPQAVLGAVLRSVFADEVHRDVDVAVAALRTVTRSVASGVHVRRSLAKSLNAPQTGFRVLT